MTAVGCDSDISNAQHRHAGHRKPWSLGVRSASSLAAIAAFLTGAWVSLLAGIYTSAFQSPNPDPALDGDPCCGHPDTWGNVIVGGIYFAAAAIVALGLLTLSFILVWSVACGGVPAPVSRHARGLRRFGIVCVACVVAASWAVGSLFPGD